MTNVMISTFTLSTFHSCQVTDHLTPRIEFTLHNLLDVQDAAHINHMYDDLGYRHKLLVDRLLSQVIRKTFQVYFGVSRFTLEWSHCVH